MQPNSFSFVSKLLSLLATPLLLLFSNAVTIYLNNQAELGFQLALLTPFLLAVVAVVAMGVVIIKWPRSRSSNLALWMYYLAGPAFLFYGMTKGMALEVGLELPLVVLLAIVYLFCCVWLRESHSAHRAVPLFALLSILLLLSDSARFLFGVEKSAIALFAHSSTQQSIDGSDRPNIYHIILDEFQTEHLVSALNDESKRDFAGFTLFENASALYDVTKWSIPSIFLGQVYRFDESPMAYQEGAFNSEKSVLKTLKDQGYQSIAYTRKLVPFEFRYVDRSIAHSQNIDVAAVSNNRAFFALWLYSTLPEFVTLRLAQNNILLDSHTVNNLRAKTFLSETSAHESMGSFRSYLKQEPKLAAKGRYTMLHLLLPHSPYIFDEQCVLQKRTQIVAQSACATRLMQEFVHLLKRERRFDDSLIIVHGDHGSRPIDAQGNQLSKLRSHRTVFMVKPPKAQVEFQVSEQDVTLADVSYLIREYSRLDDTASTDSDPMTKLRVRTALRPERYFFRFNGERRLKKYRIVDQQLEFVGDVPIPFNMIQRDLKTLHTPMISINQVVEAENMHLSSGMAIRSDLPGVEGNYVVNGHVSFRFTLDMPATVELSARVITPNPHSANTTVRFNYGRLSNWRFKPSRDWQWSSYPELWELQPGEYAVSLELDRPVYWDQIKLSTR